MQTDYAWSLAGTRAHVHSDKRKGKHVSLLAAMSLEGVTSSLLLAGSVDSAVFAHYVREYLIPTLREGQIVVLDNCKIHLGDTIKELIEACGAQLWLLPAYSPDLSPIENAFSKLKPLLKASAASCLNTLSLAVQKATNSISLADILGWFRLCGYSAHYL